MYSQHCIPELYTNVSGVGKCSNSVVRDWAGTAVTSFGATGTLKDRIRDAIPFFLYTHS